MPSRVSRKLESHQRGVEAQHRYWPRIVPMMCKISHHAEKKSEYTYLANVHIVALRIELRVVVIKNPEISLMGSGHFITRIIRLDHISIGAIIAVCSQAQGLPWHQIRAFRVDTGIQDCKLISTEELEDARFIRLCTHVETCWAAETPSQISPAWTVYVRVHC